MDTLTIIFLFFLIPGILLFVSLFWLAGWRHFRLYLTINVFTVAAYFLYLIYGNLPFIGHDEYGLQRLGYLIVVPVTHIYINFFLALWIKWKYLKAA